MDNKNASKLTAGIIILLLVLAGPAQAFNILLDVDNSSPTRGQTIIFTVQIDIETGERLPIETLALTLSGPEKQICEFYPTGELKQECKGIVTIERTQTAAFGYGYGYGYGYDHEYTFGYGYGYGYGYDAGSQGKITYKITLDTTEYLPGAYSTEIEMHIENQAFSENGPQLTINADKGPSSDEDQEQNECTTTWTCTAWTECVLGHQYRSCSLVNPECSDYALRPTTAQTCNLVQNLAAENTAINNDESTSTEEKEWQDAILPPNLARITGSVVGPFGITFADAFLVIAGFVIVIGGLSTILLVRKLSLKRKLNRYLEKLN